MVQLSTLLNTDLHEALCVSILSSLQQTALVWLGFFALSVCNLILTSEINGPSLIHEATIQTSYKVVKVAALQDIH